MHPAARTLRSAGGARGPRSGLTGIATYRTLAIPIGAFREFQTVININ